MSKAERKDVTFYFVLTPGGRGAPQATLELVDKTGNRAGRASLALSTADPSGRIAHVGRLAIEQVPPGKYTVRLTVTQGEQVETRDTTVEIVS